VDYLRYVGVPLALLGVAGLAVLLFLLNPILGALSLLVLLPLSEELIRRVYSKQPPHRDGV
jgi:hypothetical protein